MLQIVIANHVYQGLYPTPSCSIIIISFIMIFFYTLILLFTWNVNKWTILNNWMAIFLVKVNGKKRIGVMFSCC